MVQRKYIFTNFAQGNAPYIICGHLAKKIQEKSGENLGVIFPLVYGEKQKRILKQEFGDFFKNVFFDKKFGEILNSVFYSGNSFEEYLKKFISSYNEKQNEANNHFKGEIVLEDSEGKKQNISLSDILCEISRNPKLSMPVSNSFYTSFAFYSDILKNSLENSDISINSSVLLNAADIFEKIEKTKSICFIQQPNSFSYLKESEKKLNVTNVPIFNLLEAKNTGRIQKGIYVTISGITGLENFYECITKLGLKVYSSEKIKNVNSEILPPEVLTNKDILFHFCRSGWGSVSSSIIAEKPVITTLYQKGDDPEIYFNNKTLKELELAIFLESFSDLNQLLNEGEKIKQNYTSLKKKLVDEFGTINAFDYTAEKICEQLHF